MSDRSQPGPSFSGRSLLPFLSRTPSLARTTAASPPAANRYPFPPYRVDPIAQPPSTTTPFADPLALSRPGGTAGDGGRLFAPSRADSRFRLPFSRTRIRSTPLRGTATPRGGADANRTTDAEENDTREPPTSLPRPLGQTRKGRGRELRSRGRGM